MPLYGINQAGANTAGASHNLTSVSPGDSYTLFNGTETVSTGTASVAYSRGNSPSMNDAGQTFYLSGCANGTTVDIQTSNQDVAGTYFSVNTMTPNAAGNAAYTDIGRAQFVRAYIKAFVSGDTPVVIVQR